VRAALRAAGSYRVASYRCSLTGASTEDVGAQRNTICYKGATRHGISCEFANSIELTFSQHDASVFLRFTRLPLGSRCKVAQW
jgi:hypothetical protein